ncbi:hypothetical protein BESB_057200 [Besnoitia besnoiti]|uniref:Sugar transport protein n=1 Tax=Besnoitia besnoiti TaxID=94643 RepID=A0A2A9MDW2_BESBE|nr:hypothetical protein BESB_057200 [Besnoitia besnoiti]PFH36069.1 hypothetical protein BESB_057200 [Besnoitia besnoiti]
MVNERHLIGGLAILVAALATGSLAAPRKIERIRKLNPPLEDPIYVFYLCCGYAAFAFLACGLLPFNQEIMDNYTMRTTFVFTWWGALSGAMIVAAVNAGFVAISRVGLAVHAAISMGVAVVTSFMWGVLVNNDRLALLWVDILAVVFLSLGSAISAFPEEIARAIAACFRKDVAPVYSRSATQSSVAEAHPLVLDGAEPSENHQISHATGILLCIVSGMCGGLSLGPMSFVPTEDKGVAFLPSFATGIMLAALTAISIRLICGKQRPVWHFRAAFRWGVLSGFLYLVATLAVIIAIPRVSFAVAYPSKQSAIIVSGLWGILFFREMRGFAIAVFAFGSSLVLSGAILLSNFTYPERVGIPASHQPALT